MQNNKLNAGICLGLLACLILMAGCGVNGSPMGSILPDNSGGSKTGIWNNICMFPDGGGWALTYRALLHTSDGGRHWHSATPWDSSISVGKTYIHTGGGQEDIRPESNRILHSTDGGRNWNLLVEDKPDAQKRVAGRQFYFVNSTTVIQSGKTSLGIEISHDGGKSWHEEELPLPKLKVFSLPTTNQEELVFFNERDGIILVYMLVGRSYKLFYYTTHDGAQSWQVGTLANDLADQPHVTYLDPQHWMILQKSVILKTNDDGVQWTSAVPQLPGKAVINSNFISVNEGWAIVSNVDHFDANTSGLDSSTSLLQTKDGGKTWQIMSYQVA